MSVHVPLVEADADLQKRMTIAANDMFEIFNAHGLDANEALGVTSCVVVGLLKQALDDLDRDRFIDVFTNLLRAQWDSVEPDNVQLPGAPPR